MLNKKESLSLSFTIIDSIASEYGWSLDEISDIPMDVVFKLFTKIQERKREEYKILTKLIGIGCACGFNGKLSEIDKVFGDTKIEEENTGKVQADIFNLWRQLNPKADIKEFDKQMKEGKVVL